ncbi:MAG TPA: sugar ABC transporter permease [Chloroflexi bacterium]|jgi:multiple sugar transport system permease protein|nr:sugar ABC transporter permease [Chloroflexota bacterium]
MSLTAATRSRRVRREALEGYLWISPWLVGLLIFTAGPILVSLFLGFTTYKIGGTPEWVGLENYRYAFFDDKLFWPSLGRTGYYAVFTVILGISGSLLLAILLDKVVRARALYRAMYYLPSLTPAVATAILWKWLLHPQVGLVNDLLRHIGIKGPGWLTSTTWAIPSMILISLWGSVGGGRMIIFLAGLQGVPTELYEAADIDGASPRHKFWRITIPMISPTILFNLVLGVIGSFNVFTLSYVATEGGPNYATWFYMLHLYYNAFSFFQMGYASSLAWILFIIVMVLSFVQIKTSQRWVYYDFSEVAQ